MTQSLAAIDPFYAACLGLPPTSAQAVQIKTIYAKLPQAPRNASPVPHLTSLYHFSRAGEYGDRSYPGNCGGLLIRDLLRFFKAEFVLDPMSGSGTCGDVCLDLGITCMSWDIHRGIDACDPEGYGPSNTFDFIWAHPPYWRQKLYADNPLDLSRAPTLDHFLRRYGQFIRNCSRSLRPGGRLAILMGDYCDLGAGYIPLVYHTKRLAFAYGLRQHCTDIIRFSHGASSSKKVYRSSFIPGLHDVCMIFEKTN
jgi:hypothetical protein